MADISASLISRAWRKVDLKLQIGSQMHILRWRRRWFMDEVLFDDRRVATSTGVFGRESVFGLEVKSDDGVSQRMLLAIDTEADWTDWSSSGRPRGVRLETAEAPLVAIGSLRERDEMNFGAMFDRAISALGLS